MVLADAEIWEQQRKLSTCVPDGFSLEVIRKHEGFLQAMSTERLNL
jgi:hypothetical protein